MMATGHQVVGFTFGIGAMTLLPQVELMPESPFQTVLYLVFVLFGALIPDIDTPSSKLGQKFWRGIMLLFTLALLGFLFAPEFFDVYRQQLKFYVLLMLPILIMVRSHRNMTHSLLFLALLAVYSGIIERVFHVPLFLLTGFIIGAVSHLFADFLTKKGIPIFFPFSKKYFRFPAAFKTGSVTEKALVSLLVLGNVWYLIVTIF
ncbi:metal-dependent hydrolase [Halobacillus salinarum]|uniref:Metal-dependent hydrolase n=1 Tax=Halobacillus salinarum TaxID=2932257 RepID=A0ABY4EL63_9BACI|nr:metal-dependent hydrolase [Halobacillus salinarum]UOQ44384.1 metal-dependent hydrolase [Halobacillus salinarum]